MKAAKLTGSSMLPLFRAGETALYRETGNAARPRPGDCAVYRLGGELLLHRVTRITPAGAVFSNDDGLEEHFVRWEDVLGRVETRNPLKKGIPGLLFHKTAKIIRKAKCVLRRN